MRKYVKYIYFIKFVEVVFEDLGDFLIVFYFDYGEDFEICKVCIDGGFIFVMIDGLRFFFEENIVFIKKVVEYVYECGVVVEVEFGKFVGIEDNVKVVEYEVVFIDFD